MPELYQYWPDAPKRTPFSQHKYIHLNVWGLVINAKNKVKPCWKKGPQAINNHAYWLGCDWCQQWSIRHMASEISISTGPANGLASNRRQTIIPSKIYRHSASIGVKVSEWLSLTSFFGNNWGRFNPYKPCIYNQYIRIIIFPLIFKFWSTSI